MADDLSTLVTMVKEMQRSQPGAKDLWAKYTTTQGGGTRDPSRHTAEFLQQFINMVQMGETLPDTGSNGGGMGGGGMGMGEMGGMGGGGGDVSSLAQQIKDGQKGNPAIREAWVNYANSQGGGSLDPNRHPAEFLQGFIMQMQGGGGASMGGCGGAGGGAGGGGDGMQSVFFSAIKQMQKKSPNFRASWSQFCANFGNGRSDPAKHAQEFHMQFLDALAQQGCLNAGMSSPDVAAMANAAPMMSAENNPAKRARTGGMGGGGGGGNSDPGSKEHLVAQIKEFSKMGEDQKELWCAYCDTYLQGTRDPNRHDASVLLEFVTNHGVPALSSMGGSGGGGGGGWSPASGGGGGGAAVVGDAEQQALVQKVKAFQKQGEAAREQWYAFCGLTKDPSRHEKEKLQEFCMMHGL